MTTTQLRLGFTGSSKRATPKQEVALRQFLTNQQFTHFHHGDCINADALAHRMVRELVPSAVIEVHLRTLEAMRAYDGADVPDRFKPPLERNGEIVRSSNLVETISDAFEEKPRSGTRATIRRARKDELPTLVIWPDGRIEKLANSNQRSLNLHLS